MSNPAKKERALITGASMGIGAVYADRLAKRGYDLILVARSQEKLNEVAERVQSTTTANVETMKADLCDAVDLRRVSDRLVVDDGITALVNNAGLASVKPLLDSDLDYLEQIVQLNVTALTRLAISAARAFSARNHGLIINVGSVVSLAPEMLNGTYSGTKAYVQNFSISLNKEVAGTGVRVQLVLPGATSTPIWDKGGVPIDSMPAEIVMTAEDMVDASMAGLDQGEFVTIPSLPEREDFDAYEKTRLALQPNLSRKDPAARYRIQQKL